MIKISLLVTILIISNLLIAQTSDEFWKKGDSLFNLTEYRQAGLMYSNALFDKEGSTDEYFHTATSFAKAKDTIATIYFLNLSAKKGWYKKNEIENNKIFIFFKKEKKWDEILEKVQENLNNYNKGYNLSLMQKLAVLKMKDQFLRNISNEVEKKYNFESDEVQFFWKIIIRQDSINEKRISEIIDEYGWPGISLVGKEANITVWLIIQHSTPEQQEYYLPFLKESVKKGESRGRDLAYLEDRILMSRGKPQKYGSQFMNDPKTGEFIFCEIEDPENVNKRRAEVGLEPIEEYMKRNNIKWGNNKTP